MKIRSVAIRGIALAACGAGVLAGAWTAVPGVASASAVTAPVKAVAPKVISGKLSTETLAARKDAADLPSDEDQLCSDGSYQPYLGYVNIGNGLIYDTSTVPPGYCETFVEPTGTTAEYIYGIDYSNGDQFYIGYESLPGADCIFTTGTDSSHGWYSYSC